MQKVFIRVQIQPEALHVSEVELGQVLEVAGRFVRAWDTADMV
jgi:hypothetical protein